MTWFRALEPYARRRGAEHRREPGCELCGGALEADHGHVVELEERRIHCACRPCALLFERPGASAGARRYRTIPRRVHHHAPFSLRDEQWAELGLPVRLAFAFRNDAIGRWVAVYPSPAGAMEAELDEGAWASLTQSEALVAAVAPDVEALLLRHTRERGFEAYLVPIDAGYELVGLVRSHWKGMNGGDEARGAIDAFFNGLRARSRPISGDERVTP